MRRSVRARSSGVSSSALGRWGGTAICLAGLSYGALGYLDDLYAPEFVTRTVLPALEVTTPALFMGGLVGLYLCLGGGGNLLTRTGLLVGILGTVLGVTQGLDWWLTPLFASLTVVGVATLVFEDVPRLPAAMVLASATLGWVSLLTDPAFPGVLVPTRPVHVVFAALFCMSAIAWGGALFRRST